MTVRIEGEGNIWAEVIADSTNIWHDRFITFRLHYQRFIHSEFMTHRMLSKNASSSRAIPVKSMLEQVRDMPAKPVHWGMNKSGMQAETEWDFAQSGREWNPEDEWEQAALSAILHAETLNKMKLHKQIVNRLLEPFQFMNVVASGTDLDNFFWLRNHTDAQPEIQELAKVMLTAKEKSEPELLFKGEWHTPYVEHERVGNTLHYISNGEEVSKDEAIKISASCAAQASYRKLDTTLGKALNLFQRLVGMTPKHSSPFEHVATPYGDEEYTIRKKCSGMLLETFASLYEFDVAKELAKVPLYCGNLRGWTQYRKMMPQENYRLTGQCY